MSLITLPASSKAVAAQIAFGVIRSQETLDTNAGAMQITSFPASRKWTATITVVPQLGANLRQWALAVHQLSDITNWFALERPDYDGPSTGYAGAAPAVNGAGQTGTALAIKNLAASAAVLLAGDFVSFDTVTSKGNTNRQLVPVTADVNSDASGLATLQLADPIRLAPADGAAVEIFSPTALFMLKKAQGGVKIVPGKYSPFVLDAIERILE